MKHNVRITLARYLAVGCLVAATAVYADTNMTVVNPEAVGLFPRTGTVDVNSNLSYNYGLASTLHLTKWVDITADNKVAVTWSDPGAASTNFVSMNSVWTLLNSDGVNLIPQTVITNKSGAFGPTQLTNNWLAFFRPDGTSTPGNASATPRIRANLFGNGLLFGARGDRLGLEIPALLGINTDLSSGGNPITPASGNSGFPAVQLLNNDGTPGLGIVTGMSDADAEPTGNVFLHGIGYLANGNIVIASESRQDQNFVDQFGSSLPNRHVVYRVVTPAGVVVKATSLVSETLDRTELFGQGVGVISNGFAIRFSYRPRHDGSGRTSGTIRLFDNDGNPTSGDINQSDAVGAFFNSGIPGVYNYPTGGNGGRGDSVGFGGNGVDAFVNACIGDQEGVLGPVYVTVYNADGTVRYHRPVADAGQTNYAEQVDAAIAPDGRVIVVMDDRSTATAYGHTNRVMLGRIFDKTGNAMGPAFYISERENPLIDTKGGVRPKVAWRNNLIAVAWGAYNSPIASSTIAVRMFDVNNYVNPEAVGLTARTGSVDVNSNLSYNYGIGLHLTKWVDITADNKVAVTWSDPGAASTDFVSMNSVWTLLNSDGVNLIPQTVITNKSGAFGPTQLTNNWLAFFRPDGTSTPGNASATPRIRANLFGNGLLFGARGDRLGLEIPALLGINTDLSSGGNPITPASGNSGFPAVQLLNNDGTPGLGIVTGMSDADAEPTGNVFLHGIGYLANGNIVIASESRQDQNFVDQFGSSLPNRHVVYRVVTPAGVVVKATSLVSETLDRTELFGQGVGVISNGFAIRFSYRPRHDGSGRTSGTIRLFDNDGNPTSGDINQSDAVGAFFNSGIPGVYNYPTGGNGGRGDSVGFGGNGVDAFVNACIGDQEGVLGPVYVTVYNADGSVRYHRPVADVGGQTNYAEQVDAAIAPDGRVIVVMDDRVPAILNGHTNRVIMGRMFEKNGDAMGPAFYISERDNPLTDTKGGVRPKVAWRNNLIAVAWGAYNSTFAPSTIAVRMFETTGSATPPRLSVARSGGNAILAWPATAAGYFTLRSKGNLNDPNWETNSPAPVSTGNGAGYQVTQPIGSANRFFQLIK